MCTCKRVGHDFNGALEGQDDAKRLRRKAQTGAGKGPKCQQPSEKGSSGRKQTPANQKEHHKDRMHAER